MCKHLQVCCALLISGIQLQSVQADEFDPPPGYYASATGEGATLKSQLASIMASGHIQRRYGDFRQSAAIHDAHPTQAGRILLVYNRQSVGSGWTSGATWNREHVWPQSRQPGSASNSTRGHLGDPHALRPCNPGINSSRSNKPFGFATTMGNFGSLGAYYFPGDRDKGDTARSLFYSATRYSGLTLVNGFPSGNQMGDLASLISWNYSDPPDTFERRRNHAIYSSALNPSFYTNNRNAFIDRPEFVWSVFGPGANNSTIYVGESPEADGSSSLAVDLGKVIVGGPMPADVDVDLIKDGDDPTYYEVTTSGAALASITGRYNAFTEGNQLTTLTVGLDGDTDTVGTLSGTVQIDNLDVSSGGTGQGAADGDDVIDVSLSVVRRSAPSLAPDADVFERLVEVFLTPFEANQLIEIPVYNRGQDGSQASLDLDELFGLTVPFSVAAGVPGTISDEGVFTVAFDASGLSGGSFLRFLALSVSDEDLPGAGNEGALYIDLQVTLVGSEGDWNDDGTLDEIDQLAFDDCLQGPDDAVSSPCQYSFDSDVDLDVDVRDFADFQVLYLEL